MEDNVEERKSMTEQQLINKKDSIEEEIKSLHDKLENVNLTKGCVIYNLWFVGS